MNTPRRPKVSDALVTPEVLKEAWFRSLDPAHGIEFFRDLTRREPYLVLFLKDRMLASAGAETLPPRALSGEQLLDALVQKDRLVVSVIDVLLTAMRNVLDQGLAAGVQDPDPAKPVSEDPEGNGDRGREEGRAC